MPPRMRVPPHTRLLPSTSRSTISQLTASNTASNSRPINPLTIQRQLTTGPQSPLSIPSTATPTPGVLGVSQQSYPFPSGNSSITTNTFTPASSLSASTNTFISRQHLHTTPRSQLPKKGAEERDEIDTGSTEYSKTGSDQDAAHSDVAFKPDANDPEEERQKAGGEGSSLDVSPANVEAGTPGKDSDKPTGGGVKKQGSGGNGPRKAGKVKGA